MNEKLNRVKDIVLPNKRVNYFIFSVVIIGIITGSIFFTFISNNDKTEVINLINNFLTTIKDSTFDSGLALKNSSITNLILVVFIWIFGMSIIGLLFNVFIIYIKAFLLGFSVASLIGSLGIKGIVMAFIYVFPSQIINIIAIMILGIYSVIFSIHLIKLIMQKKNSNNNIFKKYFVIFIFAIISSVISALSDSYLLPNLVKLVIGLYT